MKETYKHEFNSWQKLLAKVTGMWRINNDSVDFSWGYFAPKWGFKFVLNRGTYFDPHYAVSFCFIWGHFQIKLPFKTRLGEGCSMPRYGIAVHDRTVWLYTGGKYDASMGQVTSGEWVTWDLPFITEIFESHKIFSNQDKWVTMGNKLNEKPDSWDFRKSDAKKWQYDYTYDTGSEIQESVATYTLERRTWHRKWLPFVKTTRTVLDVSFDREMGSKAGSWKGGVVGTGIELLPNETPDQAIRRMEATREFK